MKRLTSGALLLAAVVAAASCNTVTGDLAGGATQLLVDPNPAQLTLGKDTKILVQNFDDQGSALLSAATVVGAPVGPVNIVIDTSFQPGGIQRYATQFVATATTFGIGLIRFTDAGLAAKEDTVVILPNDANPIATLSATTGNVGDTISFTVAGKFRLDKYQTATDTAQVIMTIATGFPGLHDPKFTRVEVVGISPDSLTIQFIAPDTIVSTPGGDLITHYNAPVEIQNSHYQYSPEFRFGPLGKFRVQSSANFGY